ncbi:hypothetical protein SAMN05192563_101893 [Paraburkholderia aspalathi]|uniref:Uncharacterized protein n=1 Tax=Paraburkholderia aspalathi TaxID=1324617 RepID=A0A1I7EEU2_9BURK|nr:hypothetical protein R75465_01659 [Paraburkholderia aspalathi]SFU22457.1 hypothetical protein SAMN05192563_101893 [Paraburkholderia aspalathi]
MQVRFNPAKNDSPVGPISSTPPEPPLEPPTKPLPRDLPFRGPPDPQKQPLVDVA